MDSSGLEEGLSFLSFKPNQIFWDHLNNIGIVNCPKGNIWNTIGMFNSGKAHVYADEALFLIELHGFEILDNYNFLELASNFKSSCDILSIINKDCGLISYKLFKALKKHGYILLRPESKYFLKPRLFETLRAEYSLFKPSSAFRKTNPIGLLGRIFEIRCDDSVSFILEKIENVSETAILSISDEMNGFCFISATKVCPNSSHIESSNIQLKQSKSQKSSLD